MNRKTITSAALAMILVFTIVLSACSNKDSASKSGSDNVELRFSWWGGQNRAERTTSLIDAYTKQNTNVKITPEFTSWDEYWNKMSVQAAGGGLPDIMQQSSSYIKQYADKGQLVDLTPYGKNGTLDLSNIKPQLLSYGDYKDELIALGIATNSLAIVYDPAMFEKAGVAVPADNWTWDDFEKTVIDLRKGLGDKIYGSDAVWGNSELFRIYVMQHAEAFENEDGTALVYDDQLFADFMNMVLRLRKADAIPTIEESAAIAGLEDAQIVHGTSAIHIGGWSNEFVAYSAAANRPLGLLPLPTGPNEQRRLGASMFMSVTSSSKVTQDAVEFLNYFVNDVEANKFLMSERGVPVSSKVREGLMSALTEPEQVVFKYIDKVEGFNAPEYIDNIKNYGDVDQIWSEVTEQIMYSKLTPEEAAVKFKEKANEVLSK